MCDNNKYEKFQEAQNRRIQQLSQIYICKVCGKKNCYNLCHLIKQLTLSRYDLKINHFFRFFIAIIFLFVFYVAYIFFKH